MKNLIYILTLFLFIATSCDTTDPKPPEEKPPGYQEDIPWPSLSDSPWPMFRGNPMGNGRYKGIIPNFSKITNSFENYNTVSAAVVGEDSCFYFVANDIPSGLVCLTSHGNQKWIYELPRGFGTNGVSTPIIKNNGDIIFSYPRTDSIYSISQTGVLNWGLRINCNNEITINKNRIIYAASEEPEAVNAISEDGQLLWKMENNDFALSSLTLSPDGNTLYVRGVHSIALFAIDVNTQSIKWTITGYRGRAQPFVDSQGNVYLTFSETINNSKYRLFCYDDEGNLRWKATEPNGESEAFFSPTMDINGNTYLGGNFLYAINYNGELIWKKKFNLISNDLLSDSNGNIIFTNQNEDGSLIQSLVLTNNNGDIVNELALPNYSGLQYFSPAISYGSLLLPYAFNDLVLYIQ